MSDERLRAALRDASDEPRLRRNWSAVEARRAGPRARLAMPVALAGGALAAALLAALALSPRAPSPAGPLALASGGEPTTTPGRDLELADGSRVGVGALSELELLENTGDTVRWWLRGGDARFDVTPGGPRRWVVETGTVTVEVLGTSFRVAHVDDGVEVEVARGTVLVRGVDVPGGLQRLTGGESIRVAPERAREATVSAHREPVAALEAAPVVEPEPVRASERSATRPLATARTPSEEAAPPSEAAEAPLPSEPEPVARPARRDLREADALRAEGRTGDAAALLGELARDASEPRADRALAAFTLARLELDRLDRPREAAAAFALAIDLGLDAPLVEAARARRVEALSRGGDVAAARDAAREYVRHHPAGRWRHQVERWAEH